MHRKILWVIVSGLMVLSLVLSACGPAAAPSAPTAPAAPTTPATQPSPTPTVPEKAAVTAPPVPSRAGQEVVVSADKPKYGGTLVLTQSGNVLNWNDGQTVSWNFLYDPLHGGNWISGAAGGYGKNETDWTGSYDRFDHYDGWAAESYKWSIDPATDALTIVYQIRHGLHFHVVPSNANSALANGREMTADDVIFTLNWMISPGNFVYLSVPELRDAKITKTGPWEVTVKLPKSETLMPALTNLNGKYAMIRSPEVFQKYGSFNAWDRQIGTGPFMLKEYIPDSQAILIKNPNYWARNPIGPGKGDQLPYVDAVKYLVIPDLSTQQAAMRTGKLDQIFDYSWDDAATLKRQRPELKSYEYLPFYPFPGRAVSMRVDMPPFNDIRVRRAMLLATDFESIRQNVNGGKGIIITYPFMLNLPYKDLYIGLDDPDMPAEVKDLYTYNPQKAKQLLKDAGYPNGLKTQLLTTSGFVDYLAIYKDMWSKVGVDVEFMVRDTAAITNLVLNKQHPPLTNGAANAVGRFYQPWTLTGDSDQNHSVIHDPVIEKTLGEIRTVARTDLVGGMKLMRTLTRDYILAQAFAIPAPSGTRTAFWWPWLKNYNGELQLLLGTYSRWAQWVWLDQDLKKSMGY